MYKYAIFVIRKDVLYIVEKSLPVSDKSWQGRTLDEDFKIWARIEVSQTVQPDLNDVGSDFLRLSHLDQHLVDGGSHQWST